MTCILLGVKFRKFETNVFCIWDTEGGSRELSFLTGEAWFNKQSCVSVPCLSVRWNLVKYTLRLLPQPCCHFFCNKVTQTQMVFPNKMLPFSNNFHVNLRIPQLKWLSWTTILAYSYIKLLNKKCSLNSWLQRRSLGTFVLLRCSSVVQLL